MLVLADGSSVVELAPSPGGRDPSEPGFGRVDLVAALGVAALDVGRGEGGLLLFTGPPPSDAASFREAEEALRREDRTLEIPEGAEGAGPADSSPPGAGGRLALLPGPPAESGTRRPCRSVPRRPTLRAERLDEDVTDEEGDEDVRDSEAELRKRWPDKYSIFKRVWDRRRTRRGRDPDDA